MIQINTLIIIWFSRELIFFSNTLFVFIEANPIPTEQTVASFNELRTDIVLMYELKQATLSCEFELQTLRHRFESVAPGQVSDFLTFHHFLIHAVIILEVICSWFCVSS